MTQDFRETKIEILSEKHSRAFQKAVIAAGGGWHSDKEGVMYLFAKFIFVDADLNLGFENNDRDYFDRHKYTEIQFPIPTKDIYTKHKEETQMKQLIIHVDGLTIEEKQRVAEALAKIKNVGMCNPTYWDKVDTLYGPSADGVNVGFNNYKDPNPTHSPQQVLEMAGMAPTADQHVFLADALIITDSTGNIIYDSTLGEKKKGHIHAELMTQYAEDAMTHAKPWELWQFLGSLGWSSCGESPRWNETKEYRRKPKTHYVHGVEIPELRTSPEYGEGYYLASTSSHTHYSRHTFVGDTTDMLWAERGLTYQFTDEGMQAAILHSKAMLGID